MLVPHYNNPPYPDAIKKSSILSAHSCNSPIAINIERVLATPEVTHEADQLKQLAALLPRWRQIPLYRDLFAGASSDL
jgi:hypothetical protein